jgi:FKBP-type peptidyl-prolyl cis-trans isomerase
MSFDGGNRAHDDGIREKPSMTFSASLTRLTAIAAPMLVLLPGGLLHASPRAANPAATLTGIAVSFKVDPRLIDPTRGGEQWISPPIYSGANAQDTVEARAQGIDANGRPTKIDPRWIPSNPEMVKVSPGQADQVRIVVKRAGESKLKIVSGKVSKELLVRASYRGPFIQIQIVQPRVVNAIKAPAAPLASALDRRAAEAQAAALKSRTSAENEKNLKEGVVTLPSGVEYKILKAGAGNKPNGDDTVECHYRVTLLDGSELANSHASGQPVTVRVAAAIASLKETLQLMQVGSKWQVFLPAHLSTPGLGRRHKQQGRAIPTRVLEVELIAINAPASVDTEAAASRSSGAPQVTMAPR